jgi:hypothetical protein
MIGQNIAYWSVPSAIRCIKPQGIYEYCLRSGVKSFSLNSALAKTGGGVYTIEFDRRGLPVKTNYTPK